MVHAATPAVSIANRTAQLEKEIQIVWFFDVPDTVEPCVMYAWAGGYERGCPDAPGIVYGALPLVQPLSIGRKLKHIG
jgi:hypothetical protein